MRLWMSEEIAGDVDDAYAAARRNVEHQLNAVLTGNDYGSGVVKWALIGIVMPKAMLGPGWFREVFKYHKRKKEVEFRLRIDYEAFAQADPLIQRKLIVDALLRSLDMFGQIGVTDCDVERLRTDVLTTAQQHGWV